MRLAWLLVSWVVVAALAGGAAWAVAWRPLDSPTSESADSSYPLSLTQFVDGRQVNLNVTPAVSQPLTVRLGGVSTRLACQVGTSWRSGESPVAVDGQPLLLLSAASPWHRDLVRGDKGTDVSALQEALVALGDELDVTGVFDAATLAAWQERTKSAGMAKQDGFRLGTVIWLPTNEVRLVECPTALGQDLTPGQTIAKIDSGEPTLSFTPPADLLPGERELVVDETAVPLTTDLLLTPEAAAALLNTPQAGYALTQSTEDGKTQLSGILQLTTPVEVYAVPASAVHRDSQGTVCVFSAGTPHAAEVISSSLGLTYVRLFETPPASVDVYPKPDAKCG